MSRFRGRRVAVAGRVLCPSSADRMTALKTILLLPGTMLCGCPSFPGHSRSIPLASPSLIQSWPQFSQSPLPPGANLTPWCQMPPVCQRIP